MAGSLKPASILFAPLGKVIISMDALTAGTPEKWKHTLSESFKNMLVLIICLSIWLIRCFLQPVNNLLPSSIAAIVDIITNPREKIEEEIASETANPLARSAIGRALCQVLALMNETPVNSRKYEFVRNLADNMIEENLKEESPAVREVNRMALSAGFGRTLKRLDSSLRGLRDDQAVGVTWKVMRRIPFCKQVAPYVDRRWGLLKSNLLRVQGDASNGELSRPLEPPSWQQTTTTAADTVLAEKLAMELSWIAQKLARSSAAEEAILQWSEAASLANLSVSAHPRVQGSLVRVSVFLFKELAKANADVEGETVKMLMRWVPLLSNATNGVESLVLSSADKAEMESVLGQTIHGLAKVNDREMVLATWLHHYAHSSSDWPNLLTCYHEWCTVSRRTLC